MRRLWKNLFLLSVAANFFTGCSGDQSALNPVGEQADEISRLWWIFCAVMSVIYALVLFFTAVAISRRQPTDSAPMLTPDPQRERHLTMVVGGLVAITAIILFYFMIRDFMTGRQMRALSDPQPLKILVTGHQWWWEVQYENETPAKIAITANEIHVPVGKAVQFDLQSADVIHSFWAPNFDGKKDMVPGHPTSLWFRATKPGKFFGQCAEFCGLQHAHMRFEIVAETPEQFQNWLAAQNQSGPPPADDLQKHGQQVFLSGSCVLCHTISGTPARGTVGPDLSHIGSRQKIAAGTLDNTPGNLARWIPNAQSIKPGVVMPKNNLSPADLQAVVTYLENLK